MNRWTRSAGCLALLSALFACKPKADDTCTAGAIKCVDGKSALFCKAGKFAEEGCGGPKGCFESGTSAVCDNTFAVEKQGCDTAGDIACSTDKAAKLSCVDNRWKTSALCKGPRACAIRGDKLACDNDLADVNDVCDELGDYACATDRKAALRCKDNKFVTESSCYGPRGCSVTVKDDTGTVQCDDDIAKVDDPCHTDGDFACSVDKKSMLRCKGLKFSVINTCRGPNGCEMREHPDKKLLEFRCDDSIAEVGDECDESGELACATDRKSQLTCKAGKFASTRACARKACKMLSDTKLECG